MDRTRPPPRRQLASCDDHGNSTSDPDPRHRRLTVPSHVSRPGLLAQPRRLSPHRPAFTSAAACALLLCPESMAEPSPPSLALGSRGGRPGTNQHDPGEESGVQNWYICATSCRLLT